MLEIYWALYCVETHGLAGLKGRQGGAVEFVWRTAMMVCLENKCCGGAIRKEGGARIFGKFAPEFCYMAFFKSYLPTSPLAQIEYIRDGARSNTAVMSLPDRPQCLWADQIDCERFGCWNGIQRPDRIHWTWA